MSTRNWRFFQKEETISEPSAPKKKYTRRNLVVKPEEAISEQEIACCICGKTFQNLTTKHIQSHDLTVEEYKKLCGYGPEQKLISSKLLNKLQANVLKAQQAREKKRRQKRRRSRRQKQRMLADKRAQSEKKGMRRPVDY